MRQGQKSTVYLNFIILIFRCENAGKVGLSYEFRRVQQLNQGTIRRGKL
jgi:hypothetical protein